MKKRFIIECEDPLDIILGMKCIQALIKYGTKDAILGFNDNDMWYVKKTKTGFSARKGQ